MEGSSLLDGEAVEREVAWTHFQCFSQLRPPTLNGLPLMPRVDQVERHSIENLSCHLIAPLSFYAGMITSQVGQIFVDEGLNAHRESINAGFAESLQLCSLDTLKQGQKMRLSKKSSKVFSEFRTVGFASIVISMG